MAQPLYEITEKHRDLLKLAEESEDMAQAVADTMESIEGEFEEKSISLIHVVNSMVADTDIIDTEIKRLQERKKAIVNRQYYLKEYLRFNMEEYGINKISCPLFTITLAKGRDVVHITNEDNIPSDYLNIKTSVTPMKADILKALKAGEEIPGCSIVKSNNFLKIK